MKKPKRMADMTKARRIVVRKNESEQTSTNTAGFQFAVSG